MRYWYYVAILLQNYKVKIYWINKDLFFSYFYSQNVCKLILNLNTNMRQYHEGIKFSVFPLWLRYIYFAMYGKIIFWKIFTISILASIYGHLFNLNSTFLYLRIKLAYFKVISTITSTSIHIILLMYTDYMYTHTHFI